jgi:tight adherence protein B
MEMIIRLLVLLGIFAAAFLASQVLLGATWQHRQKFAAVNERLRLIRQGEGREAIISRLRKNTPGGRTNLPPILDRPYQWFEHLVFAAALPVTVRQLGLAMAGLFGGLLALLLLGAGLGGFGLGWGVIFLLAVMAASVAVALPLTWISLRAQDRRKRIEQQFPVALDVFVRALRSGHPISAAIELLTQEMDDPIGSEFGVVADEIAYGADITDALQAMADRWDSADMRMFVVSLAVQKETGGNLAEILESLAKVIRQRAAMYMKVRALSSEGRLTGLMLTVLPIISLIGMFLVNPAFYLDTAGDPWFIIGFSVLILLFLIGVLWIRRLIDLKV